MCLNLRRFLTCGHNPANLSCWDNLFTGGILLNISCPQCHLI